MLPKSLYDILDARRHTTSLEDERIKQYVLVSQSHSISKEEAIDILNLSNDKF